MHSISRSPKEYVLPSYRAASSQTDEYQEGLISQIKVARAGTCMISPRSILRLCKDFHSWLSAYTISDVDYLDPIIARVDVAPGTLLAEMHHHTDSYAESPSVTVRINDTTSSDNALHDSQA